ncbi:MAG TPA: hypothetical protein VNZ27_02705 [Rhodanobacter sp.]|jgi:hypothetical protein|nr:hypothetical protein [Rhodanobacter sp.]
MRFSTAPISTALFPEAAVAEPRTRQAIRGLRVAARRIYFFIATNDMLDPCNLSSTEIAMLLPSATTVIFATPITLPSFLRIPFEGDVFAFFWMISKGASQCWDDCEW